MTVHLDGIQRNYQEVPKSSSTKRNKKTIPLDFNYIDIRKSENVTAKRSLGSKLVRGFRVLAKLVIGLVLSKDPKGTADRVFKSELHPNRVK